MDIFLVLLVVLIVVIMWRGPKTLPKIGEALGRGVSEAKVEATNVQNEIQARTSETPTADAGPIRSPDDSRRSRRYGPAASATTRHR